MSLPACASSLEAGSWVDVAPYARAMTAGFGAVAFIQGKDMRKILLALAAVALTACGGGGEEPAPAVTGLDRFVGQWRVTYTGEDRGDCSLSVPVPTNLLNVSVSGTCRSSLISASFSVNGTINNLGGVTAGNLIGDGFYLTGSLNGSSGSGTWRTKAGLLTANGNWTASR